MHHNNLHIPVKKGVDGNTFAVFEVGPPAPLTLRTVLDVIGMPINSIQWGRQFKKVESKKRPGADPTNTMALVENKKVS